MAAKELGFDVDARARLKAGVDKLTKAVKITLGPKGGTWLSIGSSAPRRSPRRCVRGQRDRVGGRRGEHGRPDGQGSCHQDVGRRR